jgi:hypothetical protein
MSVFRKNYLVDLVFAGQWDPLRQRIVGPPWSVRVII